MEFWFNAHGQQIPNFIAYLLNETTGEKWQPDHEAADLGRQNNLSKSNPFNEEFSR